MILPRIVFMGSPEFAREVLQKLVEQFPVIGVVSQPDRPAGRGKVLTPPPVKTLALELGIPVFQPEKLRAPEAFNTLVSLQPDLIVVAAYGQILRQALLDVPPFGCINVHGSLLPRWRGSAPVQAAIIHGDTHTGVTIMKMDAGVDTGAMLSSRVLPISPDDDSESLGSKLAFLGADLLVDTLPGYFAGEIVPIPQPEAGVTYAPMLKKEDGALDLSQPAVQLERKIRAYSPWPGTFLQFSGLPLKIKRARVVDNQYLEAGKLGVIDGLPAVGTGNGCLVLTEIQPAGKKAMNGKDFLHGSRGWSN